MPSIIRYGTLFLVLLCLGVVLGCGDPNADAPDFNNEKGHTDEWLPAKHAEDAKEDLASCTECHGVSFDGGIAKVSCFECHLGDEANAHPLNWQEFTYVLHDDYINLYGTGQCSNVYCHGANLGGVSDSGPSCSSCHLGDMVVDGTLVFSIHPAGWDSNLALHGAYVNANGDTSCRNIACHGSALEGVQGTGFPCNTCHAYP